MTEREFETLKQAQSDNAIGQDRPVTLSPASRLDAARIAEAPPSKKHDTGIGRTFTRSAK